MGKKTSFLVLSSFMVMMAPVFSSSMGYGSHSAPDVRTAYGIRTNKNLTSKIMRIYNRRYL